MSDGRRSRRHEQRASRKCGLTNSRWTPFPSCPIAGPMGRWLRFRRRRCPCRNRLAANLTNQIAASVWPIPKSYPHGRVVASILYSSRLTIDAGTLQALRQRGAQQNVVEAQTAIALPTVPHVIPKRVHRLLGTEGANGVGPALREKALIRSAAFGLQQGVTIPRLR
jgi:hypothetical protein